MKKVITQLGTWLANLVLLAILVFNLIRMRSIDIRQQAILDGVSNNPGQLLTDSPDLLLEKIQASGIPLWAWIVNWAGLIITLGLMLAWIFVKHPEHRVWLLRINLAWLVVWLIYFISTIIRLTYALSNLL